MIKQFKAAAKVASDRLVLDVIGVFSLFVIFSVAFNLPLIFN